MYERFSLFSGSAVTYHFGYYNRLYIYIYIFRTNNTAIQKVHLAYIRRRALVKTHLTLI